MKKIAILTSLLALTACGGGSGGGEGMPTAWSNDTIITQDMINNNRSAQSQELQKKLKTIEYVENTLGSAIGNELTGINVNTSRSATTDKLGTLTLANIEARYQEALQYFDILKKVMNAETSNTQSQNITNKEVRIAYSLSTGKQYDAATTKQEIATNFGISVAEEDEGTKVEINLLVATIKVTITESCENNETLKESVTDKIIEDIPVLKPESENDGQENTEEVPENNNPENGNENPENNNENQEPDIENNNELEIPEQVSNLYSIADFSVDLSNIDSDFTNNGRQVKFTITDDNIEEIKFIYPYNDELVDTYTYSETNNVYNYSNFGYGINTSFISDIIGDNNSSMPVFFTTDTELKSLDEVKAFFSDRNKLKNMFPESSDEQISQIIERISGITEQDLVVADNTGFANILVAGARKTATLETFGKTVGLSYSDFGVLKGHTKDVEFEFIPGTTVLEADENDLFVGGYKSKIVNKPATSALFKGTAIASIENQTNVRNEYTIKNMFTQTDDAKLEINNNGQEKLTMDFSKSENPWYKVVIDDGQVSLSNESVITDDKFKFTDDMKNNINSGNMYINSANTYYGDNSTATEVTSQVSFSTGDSNSGLSFSSAFGGKLQ